MRRAAAAGLGVAALAVLSLSVDAGAASLAARAATVQEAQDSFPHLEHQGLFPLCTGCHGGIEDGDVDAYYPEPEGCDGCHDGVEVRAVEWMPSYRPDGLLDFEHPQHAAEVERDGEPELACASCHVAEGGERMEVVDLEPGRCLTCHGRDPESHLEETSRCGECHRPLAAAETGEALLRTIESPGDHDVAGFLLSHAPESDQQVGRCATCHTQEKCLSCHVDGSLEPIPALPPAPRAWTLPAMRAEYPEPESHDASDWERIHGRPAPEPAECSTCHTRNDCAACHIAPLPPSAQALPPRPSGTAVHGAPTPSGAAMAREAGVARELPQEQERPVRAPGVGLEERLPDSHQSPFFLQGHPTVAAAQPQSCASCHTQSYCAECHDAPRTPGYHPPDFVTRHAAEAGRASMDCSNCHNTQAFCRQCHVEVGFESQGRLGPGYHDAEPVWLLRHGQGARQGLEQCASCHTQRECLQCHSETGAFQVNPHGPDFDPERARERNPWICSACHLGFGGDRP